MTFNPDIAFSNVDYIGCDECGAVKSDLLTCEACSVAGCYCLVRNDSCGSAVCSPDCNLCDECRMPSHGCKWCASE